MDIADITKDDFKSLVSEGEKLANSLKESLPDIIKKASESAERYEYTSVDCNLPGGWYNPDFYQFLTVSGCHRGKIKKSKNKPQKYGYEYGFDKNGRLIYDRYFESMSYGIYIYSPEAVYRVACMYENNEAFALLSSVSKWRFEGGKIKESANFDMLPDGEVSTVEKICYRYQNGKV